MGASLIVYIKAWILRAPSMVVGKKLNNFPRHQFLMNKYSEKPIWVGQSLESLRPER